MRKKPKFIQLKKMIEKEFNPGLFDGDESVSVFIRKNYRDLLRVFVIERDFLVELGKVDVDLSGLDPEGLFSRPRRVRRKKRKEREGSEQVAP